MQPAPIFECDQLPPLPNFDANVSRNVDDRFSCSAKYSWLSFHFHKEDMTTLEMICPVLEQNTCSCGHSDPHLNGWMNTNNFTANVNVDGQAVSDNVMYQDPATDCDTGEKKLAEEEAPSAKQSWAELNFSDCRSYFGNKPSFYNFCVFDNFYNREVRESY